MEKLTEEKIEKICRSSMYTQKAGERWTGTMDYDGTFIHVPFVLNPQQHVSSMIRFEFEHCPNCGGLLPEIEVFGEDGKHYFFTCTRIVDKNWKTIIAETNYSKLHEYLTRMFAHRK
jgi:hypothetical protein